MVASSQAAAGAMAASTAAATAGISILVTAIMALIAWLTKLGIEHYKAA
jgi:hypothetical protein